MKVLIVGAGPTGLTAALEFVRRDIIPEIVDAKASPSELSRAVGILPESIEKLKASGVGEEILKEGIRVKRLKIYAGGKTKIDLDMSTLLTDTHLLTALPQNRTEALMRDALQKKGVNVKYNYAVKDMTTTDENATVTFANGETKKYDWVIGSDGVNSTVREKIGIQYIGYELKETWSIADIELTEEYNPETFSAWLLDGPEKDIAVMVPLSPKRVRLVSSTPDSVKALPVKLNIENVRRAGTFKIPIKQAQTYAKGRVLLAGDSAHAHSPVGGRGMNLGIDDAVEAVKSIVEGRTDTYNSERRTVGRRIIRTTEGIRKTLISNNPLVKIFVRLVFFLVQHIRPVSKIFVHNLTRL